VSRLPPHSRFNLRRANGPHLIGATKPDHFQGRFIGKQSHSRYNPYTVPNELICYKLAEVLDLPVPPSFLDTIAPPLSPRQGFEDQDLHAPRFFSLNFNPDNDNLPEVIPARCLKMFPEIVAGIVLFDIVILNSDRNETNLAMFSETTPPRLWMFDHSHALFGLEPGNGPARLRRLSKKFAITEELHFHCLVSELRSPEHFRFWYDRMKSIREWQIRDIADAGLEAGIRQEEADEAFKLLKYRLDQIDTIVNENRAQFTNIDDWGNI
jgi:hypothetical protein